MLPPGVLRYLKGHHAGIVYVVLAAVCLGAGAAAVRAGYPTGLWAGVAALAISGGLYHLRCSQIERTRLEGRKLDVDEAMIRVDAIRARHQDLLTSEQPSLPLTKRRRRMRDER